MKKSKNNLKFVVGDMQAATDTRRSLDEGVEYLVAIVGAEKANISSRDNGNLNLKAIEVKKFNEDTDVGDFFDAVAGSKCLATAGVCSAAQKKAAAANSTLFKLSWESGKKRTIDILDAEGNPVIKDGEQQTRSYIPKIYSAELAHFED